MKSQVTNPGGSITIAGDTTASTLTLDGVQITPSVNGIPGEYRGYRYVGSHAESDNRGQRLGEGRGYGECQHGVSGVAHRPGVEPHVFGHFAARIWLNHADNFWRGTVNFNYGNTAGTNDSEDGEFEFNGSTMAIDIQDVTNGHAASQFLGDPQVNMNGGTITMI